MDKPTQLLITFDDRFIDRYAGPLVVDTKVALVELVANAWDAGATEVRIDWPDVDADRCFTIADNGHGMTEPEFRTRFCALDYDRVNAQGVEVSFPLGVNLRRQAFGRNGKGRLAGFRFSDPFEVLTSSSGEQCRFHVSRGSGTSPLDVSLISKVPSSELGTTIRATATTATSMSSQDARETIGLRFLADPTFRVWVDNQQVDFSDVPEDFSSEVQIPFEGIGSVKILLFDAQETDRTTKQHGVAWRVQKRLVGGITWSGSDEERILDGRTKLAKRLTFIVFADLLHETVLPDWSGFDVQHPIWIRVNTAVQAEITRQLRDMTSEERTEIRQEVQSAHRVSVMQLGPVGRHRWASFVDEAIASCTSITPRQLVQLSGILAKLELAESKYGILERLHDLPIGDLDDLNEILEGWSVRAAKEVLDELEWRLRLIHELRERIRDTTTLEVQELQPLMERCLWMFGPEYDVIDYTSNQGMTQVISLITGNSMVKGSRRRPDFVITPEGTAGFYSYPRYDDTTGQPIDGVGRLVIVELKKPGLAIGSTQKEQPWKYVKELYEKGALKKGRDPVQAWILGTSIASNEEDAVVKAERTVHLVPMTYETLLTRAHARTFQLHDRIHSAPFLQAALHPIATEEEQQPTLDLRRQPAKNQRHHVA